MVGRVAAVAALMVALVAGGAARADEDEPSPRAAGRVLGAKIGVMTYATACESEFRTLRDEIEYAVAHWRLRNDAGVAQVRSAFQASIAETHGDRFAEAELARLERMLAGIGTEIRTWFEALPDEARAQVCFGYAARLDAGEEDIGFKYRADLSAWLGKHY